MKYSVTFHYLSLLSKIDQIPWYGEKSTTDYLKYWKKWKHEFTWKLYNDV